MSLLRGLVKTAVVIKVAQVAQRELAKPENQRKIREGIARVKARAAQTTAR